MRMTLLIRTEQTYEPTGGTVKNIRMKSGAQTDSGPGNRSLKHRAPSPKSDGFRTTLVPERLSDVGKVGHKKQSERCCRT